MFSVWMWFHAAAASAVVVFYFVVVLAKVALVAAKGDRLAVVVAVGNWVFPTAACDSKVPEPFCSAVKNDTHTDTEYFCPERKKKNTPDKAGTRQKSRSSIALSGTWVLRQ